MLPSVGSDDTRHEGDENSHPLTVDELADHCQLVMSVAYIQIHSMLLLFF